MNSIVTKICSRESPFIVNSSISLLILLTSSLYHPHELPSLISCLFKLLTGLSCPGCGMTHAFCGITHGEFLYAFQCNPISFAIYLLLIITGCYPLLQGNLRNHLSNIWNSYGELALLSMLVGYGICRNLINYESGGIC